MNKFLRQSSAGDNSSTTPTYLLSRLSSGDSKNQLDTIWYFLPAFCQISFRRRLHSYPIPLMAACELAAQVSTISEKILGATLCSRAGL